MRKSGFLTFLFSLLPGAGHMYLNMMKKGVCIMSLFFALWGVGAFLRLDFLQLLLPVVWFYAFFDVMNIRHLPSVQREDMDRAFWQNLTHGSGGWQTFWRRRHVLLGVALIVLGVYSLLRMMLWGDLFVLYHTMPWLYDALSALPSLVIAIAIIVFGVHLVRGKKVQQPKDDLIALGEEEKHDA